MSDTPRDSPPAASPSDDQTPESTVVPPDQLGEPVSGDEEPVVQEPVAAADVQEPVVQEPVAAAEVPDPEPIAPDIQSPTEAPVSVNTTADRVEGAPVSPPPLADPPTPEPAPAVPETRLGPVFAPAPPPPREEATSPVPPETTEPQATAEVAAIPPVPEPADADADADADSGDLPGEAVRTGLSGRWPLVVLPLVVIAVVVAAFAVKRNTDKAVEKVKTPAAFVTFSDKEMGFSIKYPGSWKRVSRADSEVRLLVSNGALDSLLVRVARTPAPFPPNLTGEEAKAVADVVLKRDTFTPEQILREQALNVNGSPGYYYLYTFEEEVKTESGTQKVQGVHAHYLIFEGRRVFVLVFQALPTANFDRLAKTFDAMAESFRVSPLASDAPDPTTAPPDTTPPSAPPAPPDTPPAPAPTPPG